MKIKVGKRHIINGKRKKNKQEMQNYYQTKNVFKTNVNKKIYIKEFHLDKNITIKKRHFMS